MLIVFVIFIGFAIFLAALLAMGAVPEIYKQSELINQTLLNQYEDTAREKQSENIRKDIKNLLIQLDDNISEYIVRENNTTQRIINKLIEGEERIEEILKNQERVMNDHDIIAKAHDNMTSSIGKITRENNEILDKLTLKLLTNQSTNSNK